MREVSLTDMPEWEALRGATDDLYEAFSPYPLRTRSKIPRCTHCVSDADDAQLRAKPLRELTDDELGIVLHNPGTWGEEVGNYSGEPGLEWQVAGVQSSTKSTCSAH